MKERPIIFNSEMVKAILDGRKSQTRRVVKPTPSWSAMEPTTYGGHKVDWQPMDWIRPYVGISDCRGWFTAGLKTSGNGCYGHFRCPYGKPGDRLWVREKLVKVGEKVYYAADGILPVLNHRWKWTPSIHMMRIHSRITLEITGVRVERLQDISEEDARAEGYSYEQLHAMHEKAAGMSLMKMADDSRLWFRELWDKINGKKHPWASNPWVWVIEFKRIEI